MSKAKKLKKEDNVPDAVATDKCPRVWEKARRDRMKILFDELGRLLPKHDPATPASRPKIIQKTIEHIRDLQAQNEELLKGGFDEAYKDRLDTWKKRVKELLSRVEQLSEILRTANITVPQLAFKTIPEWTTTQPKHWSNKVKIPQEQVEDVIKSLSQRSKKKVGDRAKKGEKRKNVQSKENKPEEPSPKKRKVIPGIKKLRLQNKKRAVSSAVENSNQSHIAPETTSVTCSNALAVSNSVSVLSLNTNTSPTKAISLIQPAPAVPIQANPIGQASTYILTNQGNLVPLLGTGVLTPVIINRPPSLLVMQPPTPQICAPKPPPNKMRIERESTVMTFANKKPIPALSKQSHARKVGKCVAHKNKNKQEKSQLTARSGLIPAVSPTANFLNSFPVVTTPRVLGSEETQKSPSASESAVNAKETATAEGGDSAETEVLFTLKVPPVSISGCVASKEESTSKSINENVPEATENAAINKENPMAKTGTEALTKEDAISDQVSTTKLPTEVVNVALDNSKDATHLPKASDEIKSPEKASVPSGDPNATCEKSNMKCVQEIVATKETPEEDSENSANTKISPSTSIPSAQKQDSENPSPCKTVSEPLKNSDPTPQVIEPATPNKFEAKLNENSSSQQKVADPTTTNVVKLTPNNVSNLPESTIDKLVERTKVDGNLPTSSVRKSAPVENESGNQEKSDPPLNTDLNGSVKESPTPLVTTTEAHSTPCSDPTPVKISSQEEPIKVAANLSNPNPIAKTVTSANPTTSNCVVGNTVKDIRVPATTTSWSSPLPIMSTTTSGPKAIPAKDLPQVEAGNQNNSWLPLPNIYSGESWRNITTEPIWSGGQTFTEPWTLPPHSNNYNQPGNPNNFQFPNDSTIFSGSTAGLTLPHNVQSNSFKGPWDSSALHLNQESCTYLEGPYPPTSFPMDVIGNRSGAASYNTAGGSFVRSQIPKDQPISKASSVEAFDNRTAKPRNQPKISQAYNSESSKAKTLYVPSLSEPWCVQKNSTPSLPVKQSAPLTSGTAKSDKVLITSTIDEPWKTPTFSQQTPDAWSLNNSTFYGNSSSSIPNSFNNEHFSYPAISNPVVDPLSKSYRLPQAGLPMAACSEKNAAASKTLSKRPVQSKESTLAIKEPWKGTQLQDMRSLPTSQTWKDPLPISKIAESAHYTTSHVTTGNMISTVSSSSSALFPSGGARNQATAPQIAITQSFGYESWGGRNLEPFPPVMPQYCADSVNPKPPVQTALTFDGANDSSYLVPLPNAPYDSSNFPPSFNDAKFSIPTQSQSSTKKSDPVAKALSHKFAVSSSFGTHPTVSLATSLPAITSNPVKKLGKDPIQQPDMKTMYGAGSQAHDSTLLTNCYPNFGSSTPFSHFALQPPATSSSSSISTSEARTNVKKDKKESEVERGKTADKRSSTCGLSSGKFDEKVADVSGGVWNAQYVPQMTANDPIAWNQEYACPVDTKEANRNKPVNWMTETEQRTDSNYLNDDSFPPRNQNIFDFLNNPLDQDGGKSKKKDDCASSQDYFGWMSMKVDSLVVPSTLPTLVGDLALGNEAQPAKRRNPEHEADKTYQAPYTNLSKGFYDAGQTEAPKDSSSTETIVLKNIFELPTATPLKQRQNTGQNTFLSVSQLVETSQESTTAPSQNVYYSDRTKNQQNWKFGEKKCQQVKTASNYSAEALLRPETMPSLQNFGLQTAGYSMDYPESSDHVIRADKLSRQEKHDYYMGQELKSSKARPRKPHETSLSLSVPPPQPPKYHTYSKMPSNDQLPPSSFAYSAPPTSLLGTNPYSPSRKPYSKTSLYPYQTDLNQKSCSQNPPTPTVTFTKPSPTISSSYHLHNPSITNHEVPFVTKRTPSSRRSSKNPSMIAYKPPMPQNLVPSPLSHTPLSSLVAQPVSSSGSSLANFNLSTIFPEMNKKGYQYS